MPTVFPIQANSWTILSPNAFIKAMDKSSFLHHGTGIPIKIKTYWGAVKMKHGDVNNITIRHDEIAYKMKITCDKYNRTRLFWASDFSSLIAKRYNELLDIYQSDNVATIKPEMRFRKTSPNSYEVEFVDTITSLSSASVVNDPKPSYTYEAQTEGKVIYQYGKRYERNQHLREDAIKIHGLTCKACKFNYENTYGEWGKGYIEIHHTKPLYINEQEVSVDPMNDLIPVCSNCHTMMHRKRATVLSVEEIKHLLAMARGAS